MSASKKIYGEELIAQAEQFVSKLNGSSVPALSDIRQKSLKQLKETGFPGPKSEEYKFTRLTKAASGFNFSGINEASSFPNGKIDDIRKKHQGANVLFFINGNYKQEISDIVSPDSEVTIKSLEEVVSLQEVLPDNTDEFAVQNDVFANSGVLVEVAKGKSVAAPIICYYISNNSDAEVGFVKNIYLANESSKADFVHFHLSADGGKTFINESKNYIVKQNAQVSLYKIQDENTEAVYVGNTDVYQERDSVFSSYVFTFGGELVRNNLTINLEAENCEGHNELYKGIIDDQSRGVFNGKIFVRQAAQKTNAFQSNGNILLSDSAVVNTKPQLEIWADDVKCSHGCTTGQLDEEAIFYLRSRGIEKEKAKSMILLASVAEVIEKVKLGWLKVEITDKVVERLDV